MPDQHLPLDVARCAPSCVCPQAGTCARAMDLQVDQLHTVIDATVLRVGRFCPMFIDVRFDLRVAA